MANWHNFDIPDDFSSISPKHSGKLTALVESGVGVGLVIGAPIGSLMFGVGGYIAPFASSGAFEVFLIFIAIFSLPAVSASRPVERSESLDSSPGSSSSSGSSQCGDLGRLNSNRTAIIIDNRYVCIFIFPLISRKPGWEKSSRCTPYINLGSKTGI